MPDQPLSPPPPRRNPNDACPQHGSGDNIHIIRKTGIVILTCALCGWSLLRSDPTIAAIISSSF